MHEGLTLTLTRSRSSHPPFFLHRPRLTLHPPQDLKEQKPTQHKEKLFSTEELAMRTSSSSSSVSLVQEGAAVVQILLGFSALVVLAVLGMRRTRKTTGDREPLLGPAP
jgi:hypothetical protein